MAQTVLEREAGGHEVVVDEVEGAAREEVRRDGRVAGGEGAVG